MRLNVVLCRQHIGRMFKKHWIVQGQRVPIDNTADIAAALVRPGEDQSGRLNIPEAKQVFANEDKQEFMRLYGVDVDEISRRAVNCNADVDCEQVAEKQRVCYKFTDSNVLVGGVEQAKVLLNVRQLDDTTALRHPYLCDSGAERTTVSNRQALYKSVAESVKSSHVHDGEQCKLPVRKDPTRPAWNFARDYGITHQRRMELLTTKLLKICETFANDNDASGRYVVRDAHVVSTFERGDDLYQLDVTVDKLITSSRTLPPLVDSTSTSSSSIEAASGALLHPLKCNISIPTTHRYNEDNLYPVRNGAHCKPHTLVIYYNKCEVRNLYETEVTGDQVTSRTLLKLYATALAYVKQCKDNKHAITINGDGVLSAPLTMQSITTDGQFYQFGALQLNTTSTSSAPAPADGVQNVWYTTDRLDLFDLQSAASTETPMPINMHVIDHMLQYIVH